MPIRIFRNFREKVSIVFWDNRTMLSALLSILSFVVSTIAVLSVILYYGFPVSDKTEYWSRFIIKASFGFYVIKYFLFLFLNFRIRTYLKDTWFEGVIVLGLLANFVLINFFGFHFSDHMSSSLGITHFGSYSLIFIQFYFFVFMLIELSKAGRFMSKLNLGPSALMLLSFVFLITTGSLLLYMPEMTVNGIRYIDALFTSTSACCVTGLACVDTATVFTLKGKFIVMLLIQFGGINIISFATFFATFAKGSTGLKNQSILKDMLSVDKLSGTRTLLREIIFFSVGIELIGAILMYAYWMNVGMFDSRGETVFNALFHSVSGFNNAGFALWTNNIYDSVVKEQYFIQIVIMALIFFGGLGFMAMQDIFEPKNIMRRRKYKWERLQLSTRVALNTSLILIVVGAAFFFVLEYNKSVAGENIAGKVMASFFQSVSSRTAGFNSVDFTLVGQPALIILIVLMFIGASPGSTGGGIKTTTFYVLFKSAMATLTLKKNIEVGKNTISFSLVDQAYTIVLFSISLIFMSTFALTITESDIDFMKLLFEEVSAFGTVGLSTGITPVLSDAGKVIIILTMYIGRVGTLTIGMAIAKKAISNRYKYAHGSLLIG
jgi:trk system potassium uptake protein